MQTALFWIYFYESHTTYLCVGMRMYVHVRVRVYVCVQQLRHKQNGTPVPFLSGVKLVRIQGFLSSRLVA